MLVPFDPFFAVECGGVWWSVVECGGVWWSVVECGGVWWSLVESGGVWWSVVECGGVWWRVVECVGGSWIVVECGGGSWIVVECGGVRVSESEIIHIHTMRRSDEEGRRKGGVSCRDVVELTSLISIQYVIILCNDVTRACSAEIGQNLLTTHFLASLHVCDTIKGLRLVYYE